MTSKAKIKTKTAPKKVAPKRAKKPSPKPTKKQRPKLSGPQSLAAIAREFRKQPVPRNRMLDVLAYAAIKSEDQLAASEQTALQKAKNNARLKENYQNALAASKEIADKPPAEKSTARQRAAYERKSNRLLEKLLRAKIDLTLDVLGIPPTGKPEEDIYNIGMNCIGHLDYRFTAAVDAPIAKDADAFFFDKKIDPENAAAREQAKIDAHKIAVAKYYNMVLYDLKTEDVLRDLHPELDTDSAVPTLAEAYQSLFVMKLVKKKPVYRVKRNIFKGEKRVSDIIKSLEALEQRLGLMNLTPERTGTYVTEGRLLLAHNKPTTSKINPFGFMKKLVSGKKG
ncbi:MAG: hypothetical protein HKO02_05410 [Hyphomonadaceae bacterium]|nr:hypothetical protein [Hyphomonadaceae bacterium]